MKAHDAPVPPLRATRSTSTSLSPEIVSTIGLAFDIAGVIIVFRCGLPEEMPGPAVPAWGGTPPETVKKKNIYMMLSRIGPGLIVLGFALQILGESL